MRHKQLIFRSCSAGRDLYGQLWLPDEPPLFLLQLVHGINEYSACYAEFATWLAQRGVGLACHDHLPNGQSAQQNGLEQGCLPLDYGWDELVTDTATFSRQLSCYCPRTPLLILGHSLGAAVVRCLLSRAADADAENDIVSYRAAVLCSAVSLSLPAALIGRVLWRVERLRHGRNGSCDLLHSLALSQAERAYRADDLTGQGLVWLSHDEQLRQQFLADPWRNYTPSVAYCRLVIDGLQAAGRRSDLGRIDRRLPILLMAGTGDPLGRMGKGPRRLYQSLRRHGLEHTELHLYHGLRHALLHESQRQEVWLQLWKWLADKI